MRTPAPSPAQPSAASAPASVLSPMLQRLAAERATGALMRDRGTLYLADGKVVHAESPATPGIDVLLTRGGALHREGWWDAVAQA
ncbi:transcriptional regulator, partial [Streptomyces sp. NPDC004658]